jgi:hypothetical protein
MDDDTERLRAALAWYAWDYHARHHSSLGHYSPRTEYLGCKDAKCAESAAFVADSACSAFDSR